MPLIAGRSLRTPQVPATIATLDEALGDSADDADSYFGAVLDSIHPGSWPVFTLHAELEGGPYASEFGAFLAAARDRGIDGVPLGELLARRMERGPLPTARMGHAAFPGRHGVLSCQV